MQSTLCYNIKTIIVGQTPYNSDIVPYYGAAFLQTESSIDTATTKTFSLHFPGKSLACKFIRSTWTLLPSGYVFVNADYFLAYMNGGNTDPDCVIRVSTTVEFLFYSVVSR